MTRIAVLALLCLACLISAAGASASTPVISQLDYISKPLYDDSSSIGVKFRASRAATPGYEYGITMFILGKNATPGQCTSIAMSWDPKFGGDSSHIQSAGMHGKLLTGDRWGYWCRGEASIWIVEHKIGSKAIGRFLSELKFRVAAAP